jgi:hypothetical protein
MHADKRGSTQWKSNDRPQMTQISAEENDDASSIRLWSCSVALPISVASSGDIRQPEPNLEGLGHGEKYIVRLVELCRRCCAPALMDTRYVRIL